MEGMAGIGNEAEGGFIAHTPYQQQKVSKKEYLMTVNEFEGGADDVHEHYDMGAYEMNVFGGDFAMGQDYCNTDRTTRCARRISLNLAPKDLSRR